MNNEQIKNRITELLQELENNFLNDGIPPKLAKFYAKNVGRLYRLLVTHDYTKGGLNLGFDQDYNMIESRYEQSVITVNRAPNSTEAYQVLVKMVKIGNQLQIDQEKLI